MLPAGYDVVQDGLALRVRADGREVGVAPLATNSPAAYAAALEAAEALALRHGRGELVPDVLTVRPKRRGKA